jgi:predicted nucleic acid-binding protein
MRIYLDNCSFNRPFDDQSQIRIKIETDAKLYIQELIKNKKVELIWSYILEYENSFNPFEERKEQILKWRKYSSTIILENENIIRIAENIVKFKIKAKDSLHIACAIESKCDYFITTDDLLLKKSNDINLIKIVSPPIFIEKEEII